MAGLKPGVTIEKTWPLEMTTYTFLPVTSPLRPSAPVGEGATDAHDKVDPGLERRGWAEVPDGCRNHDRIGGQEFVDQFIGFLQDIGVIGGACLGSDEKPLPHRAIEMGQLARRKNAGYRARSRA